MRNLLLFGTGRVGDVRLESWPMFKPNRWLVERQVHREMIPREISRALVLNLSGATDRAQTPTGVVCP
jgi:hypothetical protein